MKAIFPSLISADLLNLQKVITELDPHCSGYHIDIMDDHFVPNLTWGPAFVQKIRQATSRHLQIHLMVDAPIRWVERLSLTPQDVFIFHREVMPNAESVATLLDVVKQKGWQVGMALNPATSVSMAKDFLKKLDLVVLMSVEPGFSGQSFMPDVMDKVPQVQKWRNELQAHCLIAMDGGINLNNINRLAELGVEQFAIAAGIFSTDDPVAALQELAA